MTGKTIVLTMYGKGESIDSVSIGLFDYDSSYYSSSKDNALSYCNNINDLELKGDNWIYSTIVNENEKMSLSKPLAFDIIGNLPDLSIQKLLREINGLDLAKALIGVDDKIGEKIFKNMSERAAVMIKEDMDSLCGRGIDKTDIKKSRDKIVQTIRRLSSTGVIVPEELNNLIFT